MFIVDVFVFVDDFFDEMFVGVSGLSFDESCDCSLFVLL